MFKKLMPQSAFGRNIAILVSGTVAAQAIPILLSPIITRLYSPESFGVFSLFISMATLLAIIATGKYDFAIVMPKQDEEAKSIVVLVLFLSTLVSSLILVLGLMWGEYLLYVFDIAAHPGWLVLLAVTVWVYAIYHALYAYTNRICRYKQMSLSQGSQAITGSAANIALGLLQDSYYYLIYSRLLGLVSSIWVLKKASHLTQNGFTWPSKAALVAMAKRYSNFPKFSLPADILLQVSNDLPIYMLMVLYNDVVVGLYTLSLRVVGAPFNIIGTSVLNVFRQEAADHYSHYGECRAVYLKTLKLLSVLSLVPSLLLGLFAAPLFGIIFGEEWVDAGKITQIMILMYYIKLIAHPLGHMYFIAGQQKEDLYLRSYVVASSFVAMYAGYAFYNNEFYSILFYSLNYVSIDLFILVRSYHFASRNSPSPSASANH